MKSTAENVHYFSAYPLKALNLPEEAYQSELNSRNPVTIKPANRIRILPMMNPYKEQDFLQDLKKEKL
jgi:hypothetical protein